MTVMYLCPTCGREATEVDGYRVCGPCQKASPECLCDAMLALRECKALEAIAEGIRELGHIINDQ